MYSGKAAGSGWPRLRYPRTRASQVDSNLRLHDALEVEVELVERLCAPTCFG